jgi:hypothetical protein
MYTFIDFNSQIGEEVSYTNLVFGLDVTQDDYYYYRPNG